MTHIKPKLRFKEFKDEWQDNKIGNTLKIKTGKPQKEVEDSNGKYPILGTGGVIGRTNHYLCDKESVLIGRKGTIDKPKYMNTPFWTVDTLFYSDIKKGFNARFMYNIFQKINWRKYNTSTGVPSLTSGNIESIKIKTPKSEEEQSKIGLFFNKIDDLIDLKGKKIDSLECLKNGYLQKLFTDTTEDRPKLRLKGFNYNWNLKQLKEIGQFKSGYGFPDKEQGGNSGVPFFKVSDMVNNKSEMKKSNNYVSEKQIAENSWKVVNPENSAIIVAKVGAALTKNRKRIVNKPFLIDNNIMAYSFDSSWNSTFGYYLFLTILLPKYAQPGALPSFNAGDIGSINVKIPQMEEQRKIGKIMKLIDEQIDSQQRELDHLKSLKKGYLQKMFV